MADPETPEPRSETLTDADAGALEIVIPGEPVPWAAKSTNRKTGNRFIAPRQAEAIGRILDAIERTHPGLRLPPGEPYLLGGRFYVPRPKGHYGTGRNAGLLKPSSPRYPTGRPDFTNLLKLIEDGLVLAGLLPDDDQIVGITGEPRKLYAAYGEAPRSIVRIVPAP